ncbi:YceD family protein [Spirulina subsalsa FACHB-351]|uniref:YceD family protein n=1 Tax=Spirulina subsalsa FACHB-351 TaxID=234711 RepID=A0ABT3L7F1_9CYAN|nr:YceD family protein [Spirulina subsalsa]MCW6037415.1 YceD family protein [Spirulina subsalsa FACHB-351]
MDKIYIPFLLQAPEKTEELQIRDFIRGLESLTPVRGELTIAHRGTYLEVSAQVETIVTLACHRCLQNYNHRLRVETTELIWLEEEPDSLQVFPLEREVKVEDLSEVLSPTGYFMPEAWLYEQLSLALPLQQVCGEDCPGVETKSSSSQPEIDHRWASLQALQKQLRLKDGNETTS